VAVGIDHLAEDGRPLESRQTGQIDASLRVAGADQNAAIARAKRENVTRTGEVLGLGLGIDGGEDGDGLTVRIRGVDGFNNLVFRQRPDGANFLFGDRWVFQRPST